VAAHPVADPARWAIDYYLRRPALTILFYPPFLYAVEAVAFALFGVSHFVAQATVTLFIGLLAGATYVLARNLLPRSSSVGAAPMAIGMPEAALWGRQVMLDVPAYALIAASACCLVAYLKGGRSRTIYLAALFLVAAIYTKYNAGFIAPAFLATFFLAKGKSAWRDVHAITAGICGVVGLLPALFLMLRFGARNIDSVTGLSDSLPLDSWACWLFYLRALPAQMGMLGLVLAACGLALMVRRFVAGPDRWVFGLLLAWLVAGYVIFTVVRLKEVRDTTMALLPLAIAAPFLLLSVLPRPAGQFAGLALGAGTLVFTLLFCPVPYVDGYRQIAAFLARAVPRDGVVVYSGYRDANLVFDLAAIPDRSDIRVVRTDKLLLAVPFGERRRGLEAADDDDARIAAMLRDLGAAYFVIQPGFWSDVPVMARLNAVIDTSDYAKVQHFDLTGILSTEDGTKGIDVYRPTYPVTAKSGHVDLKMPITRQ
jgi:hypothetical protein